MYLGHLSLFNFRNYAELEIECSPGVNVFVGDNGSGKTNLLESIYALCMTKSASFPQDQDNVRHGETFYMIKGSFTDEAEKNTVITCSYRDGKKKVMSGKKAYSRLSEHIGRFPCVLIAPNDTDLIRGGSEGRRRFVDSIIGQSFEEYLQNLMMYNKLLRQRNAHLLRIQQGAAADPDLISTYDARLLPLAEEIFTVRARFIRDFAPKVEEAYGRLSGKAEPVGLEYVSQLQASDFSSQYGQARQRDFAAGRTTMGIHKDDYEFILSNNLLRRYGSQGQQKTFVIALKLAMYDHILTANGKHPILLLDDIFDKLDDSRINSLIFKMMEGDIGQVFITDARPERTKTFFKERNIQSTIFKVHNGELK